MNSCQLPVRCRMMPAKTRQRNPTPVMRWVFIIWFVNFKERGFFLYFQKTDLTVCLIFIIVFLSSLMFPGNVIWWREAGSGSTEPQKCGRRLRSCCPQHNWSLFISALKKKTYISDKLNTYCCWSQMKWPLHGYFFFLLYVPLFPVLYLLVYNRSRKCQEGKPPGSFHLFSRCSSAGLQQSPV